MDVNEHDVSLRDGATAHSYDTGSGDLAVFSGGTHRGGAWSKDAPRASTVWQDASGAALVLPPGPVWVEVLPQESPLAWS